MSASNNDDNEDLAISKRLTPGSDFSKEGSFPILAGLPLSVCHSVCTFSTGASGFVGDSRGPDWPRHHQSHLPGSFELCLTCKVSQGHHSTHTESKNSTTNLALKNNYY